MAGLKTSKAKQRTPPRQASQHLPATQVKPLPRKKGSAAERADLYRLLAENLTDVIWTCDVEGHLTYISPSVTRSLGYSVEEMMSDPRRMMSPLDIAEAETIFRKQMRLAVRTQEDLKVARPLEVELVRKDGARIWTETNWNLLRGDNGRPVGMIGIVRDITQRKQAEELFRTLADNSPVSIYIIQDGKFRFVNRHFVSETGATEEELLGIQPLLLETAEQRAEVRQQAIAMLRGQRSDPYEFCYTGAAGQVHWALERVAPIEYEGRRATMGIFMDITERKRSEDALKRSESRLRLLSQRVLTIQEVERARIARDLHDQLGQELVFLKMKAQSLAEQLGAASLGYEPVLELVNLIDQIKATSRRIALSIRPGILDDLGLVRALQWYAGEFEERTSIACFLDAPEDEIKVSKTVATAAYRIVQETLTNVYKHAEATEVFINISKTRRLLTMRISDNGTGFDTSRLSEGTSLGLIGMSERARLAGGSVKISSGRTKGTTVLVRLPLDGGETVNTDDEEEPVSASRR